MSASMFGPQARLAIIANRDPPPIAEESSLLATLRSKIGPHASEARLLYHLRSARGKIHWAVNSYFRDVLAAQPRPDGLHVMDYEPRPRLQLPAVQSALAGAGSAGQDGNVPVAGVGQAGHSGDPSSRAMLMAGQNAESVGEVPGIVVAAHGRFSLGGQGTEGAAEGEMAGQSAGEGLRRAPVERMGQDASDATVGSANIGGQGQKVPEAQAGRVDVGKGERENNPGKQPTLESERVTGWLGDGGRQRTAGRLGEGGMSHAGQLPSSLVEEVLKYLDLYSLCSAAMVCNTFRTAAASNEIWRRLYSQRWQHYIFPLQPTAVNPPAQQPPSTATPPGPPAPAPLVPAPPLPPLPEELVTAVTAAMSPGAEAAPTAATAALALATAGASASPSTWESDTAMAANAATIAAATASTVLAQTAALGVLLSAQTPPPGILVSAQTVVPGVLVLAQTGAPALAPVSVQEPGTGQPGVFRELGMETSRVLQPWTLSQEPGLTGQEPAIAEEQQHNGTILLLSRDHVHTSQWTLGQSSTNELNLKHLSTSNLNSRRSGMITLSSRSGNSGQQDPSCLTTDNSGSSHQGPSHLHPAALDTLPLSSSPNPNSLAKPGSDKLVETPCGHSTEGTASTSLRTSTQILFPSEQECSSLTASIQALHQTTIGNSPRHNADTHQKRVQQSCTGQGAVSSPQPSHPTHPCLPIIPSPPQAMGPPVSVDLSARRMVPAMNGCAVAPNVNQTASSSNARSLAPTLNVDSIASGLSDSPGAPKWPDDAGTSGAVSHADVPFVNANLTTLSSTPGSPQPIVNANSMASSSSSKPLPASSESYSTGFQTTTSIASNVQQPPPKTLPRDWRLAYKKQHFFARQMQCPKCGRGHKIVPIVYGFPSGALLVGRRSKRLILGGDHLIENCHVWACTGCNAGFRYFPFEDVGLWVNDDAKEEAKAATQNGGEQLVPYTYEL